jgi:hypothetical protein
VSNVLAAASGVVAAIRDTEPDRNTSCTGSANLVQVRHPDGLTALYGHLKKGSVAVSVGQQVLAGAILGVVGCLPALLLALEPAAAIDSGGVDRFHPCEWRAGPERDGDRHIGALGSRGPEFERSLPDATHGHCHLLLALGLTIERLTAFAEVIERCGDRIGF